MNPLRKIKRDWFSQVRNNRLSRFVRNLDNYLANFEIIEGLPDGVKDVLVVSPHPDDESIGCGGTLALLRARGASIDVVYLTSGAGKDDPRTKDRRQSEARVAASVLGLSHLFFLDGQDGELHLQSELAAGVVEVLQRKKY